jgi:predicted DCC family thiol-disulfide oxidoreductase YuxK
MVVPGAPPHHRLMIERDLTVYHDGSCPLCRLEIGHYRAQAGAEGIDFIDVSDPHAQPGLSLSHEQAMRRFHVRLPSGELKSGASAFIEIWKVLPRWRRLAQLAQLPGVTRALDIGYRLFAPFRPTLARLVGRFRKD